MNKLTEYYTNRPFVFRMLPNCIIGTITVGTFYLKEGNKLISALKAVDPKHTHTYTQYVRVA